jgi:hypothetical protein
LVNSLISLILSYGSDNLNAAILCHFKKFIYIYIYIYIYISFFFNLLMHKEEQKALDRITQQPQEDEGPICIPKYTPETGIRFNESRNCE